MKYGLLENSYQNIKRIIQKYPQFEFRIYGSRARGDFKDNSDVDIAVKGKISEQDKFAVLNDFDLLDIPYMIDVVFYDELEKEELIKSIDDEGILYE